MESQDAVQVFGSGVGIELKFIKRRRTNTYYVQEVVAKQGSEFLIEDEPDCAKAASILWQRKLEYKKIGIIFQLTELIDEVL